MEYITERITNLNELESKVSFLETLTGMIENCDDESKRKYLWNELKVNIDELNNYEFHIEKRKVDYCE